MELNDLSGQLAVAEKVWRFREGFQTLEAQCRCTEHWLQRSYFCASERLVPSRCLIGNLIGIGQPRRTEDGVIEGRRFDRIRGPSEWR
jgi:hypothetical protein